MIYNFNHIIGLPGWLKFLNRLSFFSCALWPMVGICAIFSYDSPASGGVLQNFIVTVVLLYPLYMFPINGIAHKVYCRTHNAFKVLAVYFSPIIFMVVGGMYIQYCPLPSCLLEKDDPRIFINTPASTLAHAIVKDDSSKIVDILNKSPELANYKDKTYGESMLFLAYNNKKYSALRALIIHGANVNEHDTETKESILHDLCNGTFDDATHCNVITKENLDLIDFVLKHGADANDKSGINQWHDSLTPLQNLCCFSADSPEVAELLLRYGADPNKEYQPPVKLESFAVNEVSTPLNLALISNCHKLAHYLMNHGAKQDSVTAILLKEESN